MKIFRKIIVLLIVFAFGINVCFAAVVSDNDGAAFITKAEFDSLKNTFQSQINGFNSNIDNKIESAINAYLSGIKVGKTSKINTAFVLDGDKDKNIICVGKTNNFNNMTNELYADDKIFEIFAGVYRTSAYYMQDTYDTFCFQASYTKGNNSNYLFVLDKDNTGTVKSTKKNVKMNSSRVYVVYSTQNAQNGIFWNSITQNLDTPTAITSQNSAYVNSTEATGFGVCRRFTSGANSGPTGAYVNLLTEKLYVDSSNWKGFGVDTATKKYKHQVLYATDLETKALTEVTKTCDVAISGTDVTPNLHWPTGSSNNIHTTNKEWGSKDLITKYNADRVAYTYAYKLKNAGGPVGLMELARYFTPVVNGYGVKWVFADKSLSNVYYDGIYTDWKTKHSYAGGIPICHANKKSKVKISLKSDTNIPMAFTTTQNITFPTGSDSRFRKFKSKRATDTNYVERTAPVNFAAGVTYDFEVELNANENLFLTVNMTTLANTLTITQIGDAYITEEG